MHDENSPATADVKPWETTGALRAFLKDKKVVVSSQVPPDGLMLELLCDTLRRIYSLVQDDRVAHAKRILEARRNIVSVFDALKDPLSICITDSTKTAEELKYTRERLGPDLQTDGLDILENESRIYAGLLEDVLAKINAAQAHPYHRAFIELKIVSRWQDYAGELAAAFMLSVKPTKSSQVRSGLSNRGLAPRFVTAIAPYISGESPKIDAVTQHLKRLRRQPFGGDLWRYLLSRGQDV
jgi:hypothetical protein